jgi:hypothetical protein
MWRQAGVLCRHHCSCQLLFGLLGGVMLSFTSFVFPPQTNHVRMPQSRGVVLLEAFHSVGFGGCSLAVGQRGGFGSRFQCGRVECARMAATPPPPCTQYARRQRV